MITTNSLETYNWRWAKTYAHFSPHWYVVLGSTDSLLTEMRTLLTHEGQEIEYMEKMWRVWNCGEYRYWIDEAYQKGFYILNRTYIDDIKRESLVQKEL